MVARKAAVPQHIPTDPLRAAQTYAERLGAKVVPIDPATKSPGSKLGKGWQHKASCDPIQLEQWWAKWPSAGIGIVTGASNLVVFDLDTDELPDELDWLETGLIHHTRPGHSKRGHYVFATTQTFISGDIKAGGQTVGEIRSGNTIFVVEPTPHSKGGQYRWTKTGKVPPLPPIAHTNSWLRATDKIADASTDAELQAFSQMYADGDEPKAIDWMIQTVFEKNSSIHRACLDGLCWAARESKGGRYSWSDAVNAIRTRAGADLAGRSAEFVSIQKYAIAEVRDQSEESLRERWQGRKIAHRNKSRASDDPTPKPSRDRITQPMPKLTRKSQRKLLDDVHRVFTKWLGDNYDMAAIDLVLAAAAAERLTGEPLWVLIVCASSTAKTETVMAISQCSNVVELSTCSSEAALLSGTPSDQAAADATGGKLREIEPRGILLVKDFTSILSLNRDKRAALLAAFREVYDGKWDRAVGSEGGRTLTWIGEIGLIGAVTNAWDRHYAAIQQMGDRFMLLRMEIDDRSATATQAIGNTGKERRMRDEMKTVCRKLIDPIPLAKRLNVRNLTSNETTQLVSMSDLATHARTYVEIDPHRIEVIDADDPEGPARFAKQLTQIVRGSIVLGKTDTEAMELAARVARDCIPPLRLKVLRTLGDTEYLSIADVAKQIGTTRHQIKRALISLHALGLIDGDEGVYTGAQGTESKYRLADGISAKLKVFNDCLIQSASNWPGE